LPHLLHRGQQESDEYRDNRDHHEQLDESESTAARTRCVHYSPPELRDNAAGPFAGRRLGCRTRPRYGTRPPNLKEKWGFPACVVVEGGRRRGSGEAMASTFDQAETRMSPWLPPMS